LRDHCLDAAPSIGPAYHVAAKLIGR